MKLNTAIILCAGMGNRMGAYGNFLPKPLWPVFQTSLLGLQIHYLKSLGIKNIFLNLHHQREIIEQYVKKDFPEVNILIEDKILDVGGGIQNFLRQDLVKEEKVVLVINSDIFINIPVLELTRASKKMIDEQATACLFLKEMPRLDNEGYTEVVINENNELTSLVKSGEVKKNKYNTYVGCSLVNNSTLPKVDGVSGFFQTIADFKNYKVLGHEVKNDFYDLGTLKRYLDTTLNLWKNKESNTDALVSFLKSNDLMI